VTDKRKRAAPTIDLTATEVASAPDESEAQPQPDPPPHESAAQPQPEPPPPPDEPPHAAEQPTPRRRSNFGAILAAGIAGAVVAAGVLAAVWYLGLLPPASVTSNDQSGQIATLQMQVHDLENRPARAVDTRTVDALRGRVAKIEHDIANLPPGDKTVAERLTSADNAMKSLGVALAALTKRSDDIAAKANQAEQSAAAAEKAVSELHDSVKNAALQVPSGIDPAQFAEVQKRIAGLEQSVTAVREQITKEIAKTSATDSAARLALSAAALRDAVESGASYQAELAQVKSLGADDKALAPLAPFVAGGLPTKAELARELNALIPAMLKASGAQKAPAGFLERLQANAGKLVHISPVKAPPGDSPSDLLARIEVAATHADIDEALADLGKLPEPARVPALSWIAKAKARQQALAAAHALAADAAGKLGRR
jgi:hypothetical protein